MKVETGFGLLLRTLPRTKRGRQPNPQTRKAPGAGVVDVESSNLSSKTQPFIGTGRVSSCVTGSSGSPSLSIVNSRNRIQSYVTKSAQSRHNRLISFAAGWCGLTSHMKHTGQRSAGSRGIGRMSSVRSADSTSCLVLAKVAAICGEFVVGRSDVVDEECGGWLVDCRRGMWRWG